MELPQIDFQATFNKQYYTENNQVKSKHIITIHPLVASCHLQMYEEL